MPACFSLHSSEVGHGEQHAVAVPILRLPNPQPGGRVHHSHQAEQQVSVSCLVVHFFPIASVSVSCLVVHFFPIASVSASRLVVHFFPIANVSASCLFVHFFPIASVNVCLCTFSSLQVSVLLVCLSVGSSHLFIHFFSHCKCHGLVLCLHVDIWVLHCDLQWGTTNWSDKAQVQSMISSKSNKALHCSQCRVLATLIFTGSKETFTCKNGHTLI